jgi:Ca2+-binding RTX toxin-like protein
MRFKLILLVAVGMLAVATAATAARLDVIQGTPGPDTLNGAPGNDLIYARAGNDSVRAHDGNDVVWGGQGDDVLRGGPGNDVLYGGAGGDVMWPGAGVDVQYGGPGNDVLHALANDNQPDIIDCGQGFDTAIVIAHDPARFHGCEKVVRLSPDEAAALAAANDDNG